MADDRKVVVYQTINGKKHTYTLPVLAGSLRIAYEKIYSKNATRNAVGTFIGTVIAKKYTIAGTLQPMSDSAMKSYLKVVNQAEFYVTFWDPEEYKEKTIKCYRETPTLSVYSYNKHLPRYTDTAFNFIEI